jgi:hypothetical protein
MCFPYNIEFVVHFYDGYYVILRILFVHFVERVK